MTTETKPPVLVVLQLTGGNDYLNSVIPFADSSYYDNRKGPLRVEEDDVLKLLEADGGEVVYHDPYVAEWQEDGVIRQSQALTDELLSGADVVVILTDHTGFDYSWILEKAKALVDARHAAVAAGAVPGGGVDSWIVKG